MRIIVTRSAIELIKRESTKDERQRIADHDQAVGGILIGKRLVNARIAIVAATEPGPAPGDHQLGFALDLAHANAVLQRWFARDPDVDIIGLWHTHPLALDQPTPGDLQSAHTLFAGGDYANADLVNMIVITGPGAPIIRCFYLSRDDAAEGKAFTFVPHQELDDADPLFLERAAIVAPAGIVADEVGRASDPAADIPAPRDVAGAQADQQPRGGIAPASSPRRQRRAILLTGISSLVLVLLFAGILFALNRRDRSGEQTGNAQTAPAQVTSELAATDEPAGAVVPDQTTVETLAMPTDQAETLAAVETPSPRPSPSATSPAPTDPPSPTEEPSIVPTRTIVQPSRTPEPASPLPADLPYALSVEPMDDAAIEDLLSRAEQLDCEDCYNIDIVGPTPFEEVRIRIAGVDRPPLRNYEIPSLAELAPRAEPYTLQAFDLDGNPLSAPLTLTVEEETYYTLTITSAQP